MKKLLFILLCMIFYGSLSAQDDLYYSPKMKTTKSDTAIFKTDVAKVQYCLGKYYKQRQTGYVTSILGGAISVLSIVAIDDSSSGRKIGSVVGGIVTIAGGLISLDAEKWLKRASISISPTSLKINF